MHASENVFTVICAIYSPKLIETKQTQTNTCNDLFVRLNTM